MASHYEENTGIPYPAPEKPEPLPGPPDENPAFQDERATSLRPTGSGVHVPPVPGASSPGLQSFYTAGLLNSPDMKARITTTFWEDENTLCFQLEARGICVTRREDNHMINGTKLLNVAGMTRGRRDGILKSEKVRHVVKIGHFSLQGVWVSFERAVVLANDERVAELLYPLFVPNIKALFYCPINQTYANQSLISAKWPKQEMQSGETQQATQTSAPFLPGLHSGPIITRSILPQSVEYYPLITESKRHSPLRSETSHLSQTKSSPIFDEQQLKGARASGHKGKTGCNNCKQRRIKCDEERPSCSQCTRSKRICPGYPRDSGYGSDVFLASPTSGESSIGNSATSYFASLQRLSTAGLAAPTIKISSDNIFSSLNNEMERSQTPPPSPRESTEPARCPETPNSSSTDPGSSEYEESTTGQKEALLNRLMDYFYLIFSNYPTNRPRFTSHGSGVGSAAARNRHNASPLGKQNSASGGSAIESSRTQSGKRKADEDDDAGERQRPPSKVQKLDGYSDVVDRRLACPFFKKNPGKYQQRGSCTGPGWATAHRVKEHIYRNHALPITCPRCHEEFENDRLKDQHFRASEQCEVRDRIPVEGIDSTQKELLRRRQRTHKYMTETEKWNEIYLIIFPDADPTCLPSPYYEYTVSSAAIDGSPETEFSRYEQFLRRELPSHVQRQLELRIEERLNPIEESLRSELVDIIRDTQIHLFDTYRSLRSSTTETSGADAVTTVLTGNERAGPENREPQRVEAQLLEDDLQTFYQPPLLDDPWGFDNSFNGLLFDLSQMPPGSVDLDSGYWSVPQADMDRKESDL